MISTVIAMAVGIALYFGITRGIGYLVWGNWRGFLGNFSSGDREG